MWVWIQQSQFKSSFVHNFSFFGSKGVAHDDNGTMETDTR